MDHYSLLHSDSAVMDALTNGPLFTGAQLQYTKMDALPNGTTIHCLTMTVRRWELLQMEHN